jgi:hypothetical protein
MNTTNPNTHPTTFTLPDGDAEKMRNLVEAARPVLAALVALDSLAAEVHLIRERIWAAGRGDASGPLDDIYDVWGLVSARCEAIRGEWTDYSSVEWHVRHSIEHHADGFCRLTPQQLRAKKMALAQIEADGGDSGQLAVTR